MILRFHYLLLFFLSINLHANTDTRWWSMVDGETIHAELVLYNPTEKIAILRKDEVETEYPIEEFSKPDAAWLVEWAEFSNELDQLAKQVKGEFNHYQTDGEFGCDYYVYLPSAYKENKDLPLLFLFHPSGKGARYVKRMMLSAESLSMIVVSSDHFYNTGGVWDKADDRMLSIFKDVLPIVEAKFSHDKDKLYLGGSSGGALRAYQYTGMVQRPWAGVWANGGWLGGPKYYGWNYGKNMRIAMINGNQDFAANRYVAGDTRVFEKNGCTVELFSFEGGHSVPTPMVQYKSLLWMLNIPNPKSLHPKKK